MKFFWILNYFLICVFLLILPTKISFSDQIQNNEFIGEQEILKYAFTDKIIEGNLYYKPINTLNDIFLHNFKIFYPIKNFRTAYKRIKILKTYEIKLKPKNDKVVIIEFELENKSYKSFAYGRLPQNCYENDKKALIIIPGSKTNQSHEIYSQNPQNYHYGILDLINLNNGNLQEYIYIKPNEGIRAWNNGKKKINRNFIYNWHINNGGSYSASYIIETMALVKFLKKCYKKTIVAGLSQGSHATLINSLYSHPDYSIISSGHSLIREKIDFSGHNQILNVPGYNELFNESKLIDKLSSTPTKFLFSWGLNDTGINKYEAYEQFTAKKIKDLENVEILIHNLGHNFPPAEDINFFLQN